MCNNQSDLNMKEIYSKTNKMTKQTNNHASKQAIKRNLIKRNAIIKVSAFFVFLALGQGLFAGEYTNRLVRIGQAEYKAEKNEKLTTVQVFNEAVKYAIQDAENQGQAVITGASSMTDLNIDSMWVKKKANLQVVDVVILKKEFVNNDRRHVKVKVQVTFDFLNVPKFMHEYDKTVTGATLRTMAVPGWGQLYNNTYVTGVLYSILFGFLYYNYILETDRLAQMPGHAGIGNATLAQRDAYEARERNIVMRYQVPAIAVWAFAISEAAASRSLARIGLRNLKTVYQLGDYNYVRQTNEETLVIDFYLFHLRF